MSAIISIEPFVKSLADEIAPLAQKSWDECSEIKHDSCSFHGERGFKIQPDFAQYQVLADQGGLLAMTMRDDGVLVGYSISLFYRSLHHAPVKCANVDTLYIEPGYRAFILGMIARMEEEFTAREIVIVGWPTSPGGPLFEVLTRCGYAPDDVVMEKRICALQHQ